MTLDTARDLSLQVAAIPMTFFGMLMNSPDSEFQRTSPQKRPSRKERLSLDDKSEITANMLRSPDKREMLD
jgi:hypothetical protein